MSFNKNNEDDGLENEYNGSKEHESVFNLQNIKKALIFMKDINFDESEINMIYQKAKNILNKKPFMRVLQELKENKFEPNDFLKKFSESIEAGDYQELILLLAKNEEFINYIQDLILEKIL
ncbi:MAG: hypothetical protein ACTSU4_10930 [Promethearchaeota archaeon]